MGAQEPNVVRVEDLEVERKVIEAALLFGVPGIEGVSVVFAGGQIVELHVLYVGKLPPRQLVRDIEGFISFRFHLAIDPHVVSVATVDAKPRSAARRVLDPGEVEKYGRQRPVIGVEAAPTLPPVPALGDDALSGTADLLRRATTPAAVARALAPIPPAYGAKLEELRPLLEPYLAARQPIIDAVNHLLIPLKEKPFESLEAKKAVVEAINEVVDALGLCFECQKPGCGLPSALLVTTASRMPDGAFYFRHDSPKTGKPTQHVGSSKLPTIRLVAPNLV